MLQKSQEMVGLHITPSLGARLPENLEIDTCWVDICMQEMQEMLPQGRGRV